jgi:hypothetical protein
VSAATMRPLCHWCLWVGLSGCAATSLASSGLSTSRPELAASAPISSMRMPPVAPVGRVSVWVDLDLPPLAEVPLAERAALRSRILAQQAQVMRGLQALGVQELARVQQVRNAVSVRLDATQIDAARALPGVRSVRLVRDIERRPPVDKTVR